MPWNWIVPGPDQSVSEAITAWATILLVLVTAIGFYYVYQQARELKTTITDDAVKTLYAQYTELLCVFNTKPYLYHYLYSNAEVSESDIQERPSLRAEMNLVCEALLALIEHALMYDRRLPDDAWNNCWKPYAVERFRKSKELCAFFEANNCWYAKSLRDFYATIPRNLSVDKLLAAESETVQAIN